jgi:hypothetical protein
MIKVYTMVIIATIVLFFNIGGTISKSNIQNKHISQDTISTTYFGSFKTSTSGRRIEINKDINDIAFYDEDGHILQLNHTPEGLGVGGSIYVYGRGNSVTIESGDVKANYFKPNVGYKSTSGTKGKTYTEVFEDKQGNIRTRVYENGLLVSYKINGVEQ